MTYFCNFNNIFRTTMIVITGEKNIQKNVRFSCTVYQYIVIFSFIYDNVIILICHRVFLLPIDGLHSTIKVVPM